MQYSLNEIEALCKRAARGSGLSWGLAEDAARASRWLASYGLPGPKLLASLLELNDRIRFSDVAPVSLSGAWSAPLGRMSPIIAGAAMSDCANHLLGGEDIVMHDVTQPLLIVPFASTAALSRNQSVQIFWDDVCLTTDGRTLSVQGNSDALTAEHTARLTSVCGGDMTNLIISVYRGEIDDMSWKRLSRFAHRTYAPATAESRASGAGAGLDGND